MATDPLTKSGFDPKQLFYGSNRFPKADAENF